MTNPGPGLHDISGDTYGCDYHTGPDYYAIDFHLNYNPVSAIARGVVYATGNDYYGGNYVIILDNNGYYSYYGHLSSIQVSTNQSVREGDQIAVSGNTGQLTTGPICTSESLREAAPAPT